MQLEPFRLKKDNSPLGSDFVHPFRAERSKLFIVSISLLPLLFIIISLVFLGFESLVVKCPILALKSPIKIIGALDVILFITSSISVVEDGGI
jgi:hypothetical protein